ncbi:MAG: hypothetical protein Q8Q09_11545 [Deltaproteobacteria bacterium]|nr:hypothetical protein [Deltaproteobacteria bacterium]
MKHNTPFLAVAALVSVQACARLPVPSAAAPTSAVASSAHSHAEKPDLGLRWSLRTHSLDNDRVAITVRVDATLPVSHVTLRVETEQGAHCEQPSQITLPELAASAHRELTVTVRRDSISEFGVLATATLTARGQGETVSLTEGAWLFGSAPPARQLPTSSLELGPNQVGPLGPNEAIVRLPDGTRLHETVLR